MKGTNNRRAITVGIFVFLGIAIFILAVFTLGGQQKTFEKAITVKAIFNDVQGLQKGNNVWFSGVKIGTVKKISFYQNARVEVDINIEQKAQAYIRKDAKAKISSDGLIGNKIIVLYGGTPQQAEVETGDMLAVEQGVGSDEIMTTLQANNKNLLDITNDIKGLAHKLAAGEGAAGKLLTDETLATSLTTTINALKQASANAERLTSGIATYTNQLNKRGSLANNLITDTVVFARLRSTASEIDALSKKTNDVIQDLKNASGSLSNSLNNKNTPLGTLLTDEAAAANIKTTLQNLSTSSKKLDANMEALQHNFLLRGYFKKKAKQAVQASDSAQ